MAKDSWTEEEERFLKERYADTDTGALAAMMGRSLASVENKANRLGLRKSRRDPVPEPHGEPPFQNRLDLISREEAVRLDKVDLLRFNWSLMLMYQRELNNPGLTQAERQKLMNALSTHTTITNNVMNSAGDEIVVEEEDLNALLERIIGRGVPRPRRVIIRGTPRSVDVA